MLSRWQSTIVDAQGNVQPGARLVVFLEATQERAQVYRDRDGTDPYPLGEVVANEWGYAYFYAEPNSYRITSAPLAIDWREVVVAGEWLLEAEGNAAQSAAQALLSAQSATASAAAASDSASAASDSAANAESSETNAAASATSAQGSATQASSSAADAANSADQAQTHAGNASASASASQTSRLASETARDESEAARDRAQQWSENPEDVPVEPGQYSAYHWAKKAEGFVGGDAFMRKDQNLADVQDASMSRINLGLGTAATRDVGTDPAAVPANSMLGSAAYSDIVRIVGSNAFYKADYTSPCLIKTGAQALSIKAGTAVMIGGEFTVFSSSTPVAMPTLSGGSDYSVWVNPDGTAQAVADPFNSPATPPQSGSRKIGGFHYGLVAPGTTVASGGFSTSGVTAGGGSMAWSQSDVDRIAGINEFSIWDLCWRCKGEQRGMAYDPVADVWVAIYFMGTTPHIDGPSAYNTDVASGTVLPFIPPAWGGDGVLKYSALNSWTANELATAFGHRLIRYEEFTSVAFGATEGQSLGGPESTIPATKREPGYTSRIGLEQATGHQFVIGGPIHSVGGSSWSGNGRGSWYGGSGQVRLGGHRTSAANSGSRSAHFNGALSRSSWSNSVRAASDHLVLVGAAR